LTKIYTMNFANTMRPTATGRIKKRKSKPPPSAI
jgi:hypothetical protein